MTESIKDLADAFARYNQAELTMAQMRLICECFLAERGIVLERPYVLASLGPDAVEEADHA